MSSVKTKKETGKNLSRKKAPTKKIKKELNKKEPETSLSVIKKDIVSNNIDKITEKDIVNFLLSSDVSEKLTEQQKKMFIYTAVHSNLDPFKREIYAIPYKVMTWDPKKQEKVWNGKYDMSIVTGYEVYIKRAQRSNRWGGIKFNGFEQTKTLSWDYKSKSFREINDIKCSVSVYRLDWKVPFVHEVKLSEYKQDTSMWKKKPETMIKKTCIAQALRMCFPDEVGRIPYIREEISAEGFHEFNENVQMIEHEKDETRNQEILPPLKNHESVSEKNGKENPDIERFREIEKRYNQIPGKKKELRDLINQHLKRDTLRGWTEEEFKKFIQILIDMKLDQKKKKETKK